MSSIKICEYILQNEEKSKSKYIANKFNDYIKTFGLEKLTKKNNQNSHAFKIKNVMHSNIHFQKKKKSHAFIHAFKKFSCIYTCIQSKEKKNLMHLYMHSKTQEKILMHLKKSLMHSKQVKNSYALNQKMNF